MCKFISSHKYLGLHFDCKLNWKEHIAKKMKQTDLKAKEINWLIGRNTNLSLENKLLVYKAVIKPIWTYGIELWGCASKSSVAIIQQITIKNPQNHSKCPPVCITSHTAYRPQHPLCKRGHQRKN